MEGSREHGKGAHITAALRSRSGVGEHPTSQRRANINNSQSPSSLMSVVPGSSIIDIAGKLEVYSRCGLLPHHGRSVKLNLGTRVACHPPGSSEFIPQGNRLSAIKAHTARGVAWYRLSEYHPNHSL